ncbi:MAG: PUA domain-containing protein [Candidatus Aenigmatarchaeota archaeon]
MNKDEILEIIEYQFGKEVRKELEGLNFEIKKFKSRKIDILINNFAILHLNPKFFLFTIDKQFSKILRKCKKFYIKIDGRFLEDIKKTKNIIKQNIIDYSKDFRANDDIIILDENENLIGIAKAKLNSYEISNATYGIVAKVKKFI